MQTLNAARVRFFLFNHSISIFSPSLYLSFYPVSPVRLVVFFIQFLCIWLIAFQWMYSSHYGPHLNKLKICHCSVGEKNKKMNNEYWNCEWKRNIYKHEYLHRRWHRCDTMHRTVCNFVQMSCPIDVYAMMCKLISNDYTSPTDCMIMCITIIINSNIQ